MDTKSDRDNPFPGIGKYSRQAKGEAAVHLSGTAARFVIQTLLGFTFRTYTTVLVLPLSKIFLTDWRCFISFSNWALLPQAFEMVILSSPGDHGFID